MQNFNTTYEDLRLRFNAFAESNGLKDDINTFLVAKLENAEFDIKPYLEHAAVDLLSLSAGMAGFNINFDVLHHGVDGLNDYTNYETAVKLENQQRALSATLIQTLHAVIGSMGGTINEFSDAFALQKLLLNINPHFLDPAHYEDFQQLRGKAQLEADKYSHQQTVENNTLLKLLYQNQDLVMHRVNELKQTQEGLKTFAKDERDKINEILLQLKDEGVEINEKLINGLIQNKFIQKDVRTIISYLKDMELQKFKQQQQEIKLANYRGLTDACGFISEFGNLLGSRDLARVGQIAQAGVKIHQATDQLLNASFIGTAILSPYMAIGMAALKIFSLFQKNDNQQKIMMKQLANIARQIKGLHQDVLKQFGQMNQKLDYILKQILEGFKHLELSQHVYVESKLQQIQSEIVTLTKITKSGFEALLMQDLLEQTNYIDNIKQKIIAPHLTRTEYEKQMGRLAVFIFDTSHIGLFNGLEYEHLLEDNHGSTQQIINIVSQQSSSILHGILGLLLRFAKDTLNVPELKQFAVEKTFHPGLWRVALQAYADMQKIYRCQFSYDPNGINVTKLKDQAQLLALIVTLFSNNTLLYSNLLIQLQNCHDQINSGIQKISMCNNFLEQTSRLIYEIPEKIKKSDKIKKIHSEFFQLKNLFDILAKKNQAIPQVFFDAEKSGLGYLEVQVHLPLSVRSREHHGGFGISKGEKAGLEITFVMGNQRVPLFIPQLSDKYHNDNLKLFYSHILTTHTRICYTASTLESIKNSVKQNKINAKKDTALEIANILQNNSSYHRLLKLNHFLIAYLTYGGFSDVTIQEIKKYLLLENIAEKFAAIAQSNNAIIELPKIQIAGKNELLQVHKLIFSEITQQKNSQLAAYLYHVMLNINELEIAAQTIFISKSDIHHKPGQTYGEYFKNQAQIITSPETKRSDLNFTSLSHL